MFVRASLVMAFVAACGGMSSSTDSPGSGGSASGSMLADCADPLPVGEPCSEPEAHCGGPCSNSWQADNVCRNGIWDYYGVNPCGPHASTAPECKNSFSSQEEPCCAAGGLDCTGKPSGYPGFGCTPGEGSYCSCVCVASGAVCAC